MDHFPEPLRSAPPPPLSNRRHWRTMNRRDILTAFGISVAALLPMMDTSSEYTDEEISALERISEKIEAGFADQLYETKVVGGGKDHITVQVEWTDPDILMLRNAGLF